MLMFHEDWTADINPELKACSFVSVCVVSDLTLPGQSATPLSISETLQILEVRPVARGR